MPSNWFNNRGQAIQVFIAGSALMVAILVGWPALKQHEDLLAWWPIVVVLALIWFAFAIGEVVGKRSSLPQQAKPSEATPEDFAIRRPFLPVEPANAVPTLTQPGFQFDPKDLFIGSRRIKLGDFGVVPYKLSPIRVTFRAITKVIDQDAVELEFGTSGSIMYGGRRTEKVGVNRFILPTTVSRDDGEDCSAFQFYFTDRDVCVVVIRVDHINPHAGEVTIAACTLMLLRYGE